MFQHLAAESNNEYGTKTYFSLFRFLQTIEKTKNINVLEKREISDTWQQQLRFSIHSNNHLKLEMLKNKYQTMTLHPIT